MGGEENTHLKAMLQNQNQKILQNQNQQKILQNQVRDLQAQVSVLIGELTDSKSKERFKVLRGNWRGQNPESESEPAMMECNQTETYPARVFISTSSCIWFTRTNFPKTA